MSLRHLGAFFFLMNLTFAIGLRPGFAEDKCRSGFSLDPETGSAICKEAALQIEGDGIAGQWQHGLPDQHYSVFNNLFPRLGDHSGYIGGAGVAEFNYIQFEDPKLLEKLNLTLRLSGGGVVKLDGIGSSGAVFVGEIRVQYMQGLAKRIGLATEFFAQTTPLLVTTVGGNVGLVTGNQKNKFIVALAPISVLQDRYFDVHGGMSGVKLAGEVELLKHLQLRAVFESSVLYEMSRKAFAKDDKTFKNAVDRVLDKFADSSSSFDESAKKASEFTDKYDSPTRQGVNQRNLVGSYVKLLLGLNLKLDKLLLSASGQVETVRYDFAATRPSGAVSLWQNNYRIRSFDLSGHLTLGGYIPLF